MEFARVYDVQLEAREKLLGWVRPLSQEQYTRSFPFGMRSVRGSLVEIARVGVLPGTPAAGRAAAAAPASGRSPKPSSRRCRTSSGSGPRTRPRRARRWPARPIGIAR